MKWTFRCGTAAALLGMTAAAQAGMLGGLFSSHRGQDCCEEPCRPVVSRPCEKTYTYQRQLSNLQPPCCDVDCCEEPACAAPCDAACVPSDCCSNRGCGKRGHGLFRGLLKCFDHKKGGLCNHGPGCCDDACAGDCGPPVCEGDPCEIAKLIYQARTACYAEDREDAVDKLGDFDCRCHPEIMATLIYSLNDASEEVRAEAADEIGDLLEDGRCCCSAEVVAALTCALGDCDDDVRYQAEEALEICGYDVVEGCCADGCCEGGCAPTGAVGAVAPAAPTVPAAPAQAAPVPPTAPAPMQKEAAPAPAPPEDPEAYFPSRYRKQTNAKASLTNLFGLAH